MNDNLAVKRDKVLEIVKAEGPLLPVTIGKQLEIDLTFASAMLGEMVDNKFLLLTNVKSGGSPFYYVAGQEEKLKDLMKHLNEKDLETAELLQEKKILRDRDLNPLQRVNLRQIKDYAKPVRVTINNEVDVFWRWYLAEENEVKTLINIYLQSMPKIEEEIPKEEVKKEQVLLKEEVKEEQVGLGKEYEQEKVGEEPIVKVKEEVKDPVGRFFMENQIEIMDQKIIKKNREINYIVGVGTDVGKGVFFLKFKDKKKISEADLSLALHESGNMPLVFLSTGEITRKAKELLGSEFKGVIFKKI